MSHEFSYSAFDALENGIIILSDKLEVIYWNRWLELNTHVSKEKIISKPITQVFNSINTHVLTRKIKTTLVLNTPTFYESRLSEHIFPIKRNNIFNPHFEYMQLKITISPFSTKKKHVMIALYDVTEIFELKQLLMNEYEKVNVLNLELWNNSSLHSHIPMIKMNSEGTIFEANNALLELFEYESAEIKGKSIALFFNTNIQNTVSKELLDAMRSQELWENTALCQTKSRHTFMANIKLICVTNDLGHFDYATLMLQPSGNNTLFKSVE